MTILQELATLYEARAEEKKWPRPGYSTEKIGAVVVLAGDGSVREIRRLGSFEKNRFVPQALSVPSAVKRTAGITYSRVRKMTSSSSQRWKTICSRRD